MSFSQAAPVLRHLPDSVHEICLITRPIPSNFFWPSRAFRLPPGWLSLHSIPRSHRRSRQGDHRDGEMQIRGLLLGAAVVALSVTSAVRDHADRRGSRRSDRPLSRCVCVGALVGRACVVDGNCLSACTLVLGVVPRERICATSRARFGFHAAWMPDRDGRPITSPLGTQALWSIYPVSVRRWILRHGGLSRKMIFMQGSELNGIVASCDRDTRDQTRSARRHHAASGALRIRKRLQRSPLAPSPHRPGCRSPDTARQKFRWRRPSQGRPRSQDSLARWPPAPRARCAQETSACRDGSLRRTAHGALAATEAPTSADRPPCPASATTPAAAPTISSTVGVKNGGRRACIANKHDLGGYAERPQRGNERAVETRRVPLQCREAVKQSVARLNEAGASQTPQEMQGRGETSARRRFAILLGALTESGSSPQAASATRALAATMSQIRLRAGMMSAATPAAKLPKINANEPHSRTGP